MHEASGIWSSMKLLPVIEAADFTGKMGARLCETSIGRHWADRSLEGVPGGRNHRNQGVEWGKLGDTFRC